MFAGATTARKPQRYFWDNRRLPPLTQGAAHIFDWASIGLEMKPPRIPATNVVVEHIERPTEN